MYVRTNKKKVSPANQFSELFCFSWFSTDVNWSQYSEHSKHREIGKWVFSFFLQKLFNKDFWAFSGICANFSLQSLPIIQIQKMLLEKSSGIEISELSWILSKMSNIFGTYTSICPFCIKIWKAERLLQTITELSIKELICTGFRKCSTRMGILIFSSAQFVKIMFPLAFSELWPYFEISDFAKVENIVKNIEELVVKHYQSFQGWKGSSK